MGLSDYLKSAFDNGIANFVQPDKLAAATIFLALNLIDIIFNLDKFCGPNNSLCASFFAMNSILQVGVGIVLILLLAYVLLSFNNDLTKLLAGESWRWTLLGSLLVKLESRRREQLIDESKGRDLKKITANVELITSFTKDQEYLCPTAFGNVQNATANYIAHHYGIDMVALWPHMESVVEASDTTLSKRVDNEKSVLDFLINMTVLFIIFAIELVIQAFWFRTQWGVSWALIPILLAVITYNGAVGKARTWGDVVQIAFDIHRDDLRQKLGVRTFTSEEDERTVWRKVSSHLLWGHPADDVFVPGASASTSSSPAAPSAGSGSPASSTSLAVSNAGSGSPSSNTTNPASTIPPGAIVKTTANVQVDIESTVIDIADPQVHPIEIVSPANANEKWYGIQKVSQYIDYFLVVSATTKDDVKNVFLYVTDPRIPVLYQIPDYSSIMSKAQDAPGPVQITPYIYWAGQLIWQIANIPGNSSLSIRYLLPSRILTVLSKKHLKIVDYIKKPLDKSCQETGAIDYTIQITGIDHGEIEVFDSRRTLPDTPKYGCIWYSQSTEPKIVQATKLSAPDRYRWELHDIVGNSTHVTLRYTA